MTLPGQLVIQQTKNWVKEVVIGLNLCPFASSVFEDNRISYIVINDNSTADSMALHLLHLADSFTELDNTNTFETSLLIFPEAYRQFDDYLDFLEIANQLLEDLNYTGIYQLASFHPAYLFEGSTEEDASNYTNRSPYPMLHLLRESSIEKAVASYPNIEQVPENNINKLRHIGYHEMRDKLKKFTA
jgi:uncharacterized protein